jgi:hypothetical protein
MIVVVSSGGEKNAMEEIRKFENTSPLRELLVQKIK